MLVLDSLRPSLAAVLIAATGCATSPSSGPTADPVPVLDDTALAGCTYERIGTVDERVRSGLMVPSDADLRRAIGRQARRLGADAVIEFRKIELLPVRRAGSSSTASTRDVTHSGATGVAIRFTSPACPTTVRSSGGA